MAGKWRRVVEAVLIVTLGMGVAAAPAMAGSAASLRASASALRGQLEQSPFGEPLDLRSTQTAERLQGDIHAIVDQPFALVRSALGDVRHWCDILILHPNITGCRVPDRSSGPANATGLAIEVGKRRTPLEFTYRVAASDSDYLDVKLGADTGPLGTADYRIEFEATPLDPRHTLVHLVYSHSYGVQARLAMRAYLSTFGRGKVGFTVVDHKADGTPVYVGDFRGALERNAMRYYLCIESYLQSLSAPAQQQFEKRLQTYFAYTERWPLQLKEDSEYLDWKRRIARTMYGGGGAGAASSTSYSLSGT